MTARGIRRAWLCVASMVAIGIAAPILANAQTQDAACARYDALAATLTIAAGEQPVMQGLTFQGTLLQIWRNADTGDWTAVIATPDGLGCIVSHGTNMTAATPTPPAGDPS